MASRDDIYSFDNPLFNTFIFYTCVLSVKVLFMALWTAAQKYKYGIFKRPSSKIARMQMNEDIERVRRAHRNDLENIPIFLFVCGCYINTDPSPFLATNLIRLFVLSRIVHSVVYAVCVIPQPARAAAFVTGASVTFYMAMASLYGCFSFA